MKESSAVREQMFALISEWEQGGVSQKAFCEQHQIAYHRFHYWHKRYRKAGGASSKEGSSMFVPLRVETDRCHTEVVMPGGVRIIFHQAVTASYLIQLTR